MAEYFWSVSELPAADAVVLRLPPLLTSPAWSNIRFIRSTEWVIGGKRFIKNLQRSPFKAHSDDLRLTDPDVADGCVSAEIGNFLFFCTTHFCRSRTRQMQLVWMSLYLFSIYNFSDNWTGKKLFYNILQTWISLEELVEGFGFGPIVRKIRTESYIAWTQLYTSSHGLIQQ